MALGLIKTTERVTLVCTSDPALGGDSDEWKRLETVKSAKKKGATLVTVRALNDREVMRCAASFRSIDFEKVDEESTLQLAEAMARIVELAFISAEEGGETCTNVDTVLQAIRTGPLVSLGSWILNESGTGADPT